MLLFDISCHLLLLFVASGVAAPPPVKNPTTSPAKPIGYQSVKTSKTNFCQFSTRFSAGMKDSPLPLLLVAGDPAVPDFMYPNFNQYDIKLKLHEKIKIACPGQNNFIKGIPAPLGDHQITEMELDCEGENKFKSSSVQPINFPIDEILCATEPSHTERSTTTDCHVGSAKYVEIGFELTRGFLKTIDVCWEAATMTTHWTRFSLSKEIKVAQDKPRPRYFEPGQFYSQWNLEKAYYIPEQEISMEALLGSKSDAAVYINEKAQKYLSRGHLTAKGDFVYGPAQSSTHRYINVAPQWQCFNGGNWDTLEKYVQVFASSRTSSLTVYTGSHGQMTIQHGAQNNPDLPVYLVALGNRYNPVPKYFWKVIYDPVKKQGTAFVGVNDPWATPAKVAEVDQYCKVIPSTSIDKLKWDDKNVDKGLSYVCEINDELRKLLPAIPLFDVSNGILV